MNNTVNYPAAPKSRQSKAASDAEEVLQKVRKLDPACNELYCAKDDIAVSRLFSEVFRDAARYNVTARCWYVYDGVSWKADPEGMRVESFAKLLSRALLIYSADVPDSSYTDFAGKLQERRRREIMLKDARDFNFIEAAEFDRDPYLFNCLNCVIDLRSFEPVEHDPSLLLSKVSNVFFDPDAHSEDFTGFFREVMRGDGDKSRYLQKVAGYSLTGVNVHEELYICYGATTRNGKSTFLDTLEYLFGDYASNVQPETLAQKERNSGNASPDIARLSGVRFLHCGEPPKRMKFDVALVKSLTGGDVITARNLYERPFEFKPVFKLFINTNYLPVVTDDTLFSSGRVRVATFDRHFEPEEQDTSLKLKLRSQENISSVFNWLLDGLRMYYEDGCTLTAPESICSATNEYRERSDKVKAFFDECMLHIPSWNTAAKDVYDAYRAWCRDNGYGIENKSNFLDELRAKDLLFQSGTVNGRTVRNVIRGYAIDLDCIDREREEGEPELPF